jgi:beta-lactamase class A
LRRAVPLILAALAAGCGGSGEPAAPKPEPAAAARTTPTTPTAPPAADRQARAALRDLERDAGARIGVYAVDTGSGAEVEHRADERFAYASTFKALLAGAILRASTPAELRERVVFDAADMTSAHSPITARHVGAGMTVRALADAAVRHSDNTAANLLLDRIGGPQGLDAILAELGDDTTRMERREPMLNEWAPGATRDTTTPRAFATVLRELVLGDALDPADRRQLTSWLRRNTTGADVIRAGVPGDWVVGDKTGTGGVYGIRNDIAVAWPPGRDPIVIAVFTNLKAPDAEHDDGLLAAAAEVVADALGG